MLLGLPNLAAGYWVRPVDLPQFSLAPHIAITWRRQRSCSSCLSDGKATACYGRPAPTCISIRPVYVSYVPLMPYEYTQWPITMGLYNIAGVPDAGEQLKAFLAGHSVSAIIVGDHRYQLTKFDGGPTPDVPVRVP